MNDIETPGAPAPVYCANHPGVETGLRCKRCNKPICAKCAISTPTGYICRECENQQQKIFDTALPRDYVFGALLAIVISGIGSVIASWLGFFVILAAPVVGVAVAEAVRAATQRRRGPRLFIIVAAGVVLGALPLLLLSLLSLDVISIAVFGVYTLMATGTAYQRLKGISIR